MIRNGTRSANKAIALAASAALAAGSIVATASTATAAPGDVTQFPLGDSTNGIAEGPAGNLWVTVENGVIAKVALNGTSIGYQTNTDPGAIAAGPDGYMWFTDRARAQIGKISPEGAVQLYSNNSTNRAEDIALGLDGNMWFTVPDAQQVGKITSGGAVTLYNTGGIDMDWITPGPAGSNRVYVASNSQNKLGIVTSNGTFSEIDGPRGGQDVFDIQLINDQVWFTSSNGAIASLTRLVADSSFVQVSNAALGNPTHIGVGAGGTMWTANFAPAATSHVTTGGDVVATYPLPNPAKGLLQAKDGNVWAIIDAGVTRVLTGVVPTSSAAPAVNYPSAAIEPPVPPAAGTPMTATNGSWNYMPTSYTYQWQACTTTDSSTCTDIPGATAQAYTVATTDVGKYIRVGVKASNLNGPSEAAYSGAVATGAAPAPAPSPNPNPAPATGAEALIGNGVMMELDAPVKQKRKQRKTYEVYFTATDVQGAVVFEFSKGSRTKTKTIAIQDGIAEYRWKTPRNWRKGRTTVTATFVPSAGSPYTAAEVRDRVRIRK
jgi:virginiamycin B lyase